jgi:hypothetical protein
LKLNSITVRGSSVILFEEKVKVPFGPTSTVVLRKPPAGRPSGGEVLVDALEAACLKASRVFPEVGLKRDLSGAWMGEWKISFTYALIA